MSRIVHCAKLKKEAPGLDTPPYPGEKGKWIYENISRQVWMQWTQHQTRLINEKHLNLLDLPARKYLSEQMDSFFAGNDYDMAVGYVPEKK